MRVDKCACLPGAVDRVGRVRGRRQLRFRRNAAPGAGLEPVDRLFPGDSDCEELQVSLRLS